MAKSMATEKGSSSHFVIDVSEVDILLGRGAPIIKHPGNVRFRELVRSRKAEYRRTSQNTGKDLIARELMQEIASRNGRFLRQIDTIEEALALGVPEGVKAWRIADDEVVLQKVKQTLRDRDYVRADDSPPLSRAAKKASRKGSSSTHASAAVYRAAAWSGPHEVVAPSAAAAPLNDRRGTPQVPSGRDLQQQQATGCCFFGFRATASSSSGSHRHSPTTRSCDTFCKSSRTESSWRFFYSSSNSSSCGRTTNSKCYNSNNLVVQEV